MTEETACMQTIFQSVSVCVRVCMCMHTHSVMSNSCNPIDCSPPVLCLWHFPDKNTGVGSQRIQGIPMDWTCISCISRWNLYHLSHLVRPHFPKIWHGISVLVSFRKWSQIGGGRVWDVGKYVVCLSSPHLFYSYHLNRYRILRTSLSKCYFLAKESTVETHWMIGLYPQR